MRGFAEMIALLRIYYECVLYMCVCVCRHVCTALHLQFNYRATLCIHSYKHRYGPRLISSGPCYYPILPLWGLLDLKEKLVNGLLSIPRLDGCDVSCGGGVGARIGSEEVRRCVQAYSRGITKVCFIQRTVK